MMPQLCVLLIGYSDNFRLYTGEIVLPVVGSFTAFGRHCLYSSTILYVWVCSVDLILRRGTTDPPLIVKIGRRIICENSAFPAVFTYLTINNVK